jgi:Rad3-related DNA helicase
VKYSDRPCIGSNNKQRNNVGSKYYCQFNETSCDYHLKRMEASEKNCVIINYAFFLNCMRLEHNPFFTKRVNIICDEAHLIPDICCNMFNYDLTPNFLTKVQKVIGVMRRGIGEEELLLAIDEQAKQMFKKLFLLELKKDNLDPLISYISDFRQLSENIKKLSTGIRYDPYSLDINRLIEQINTTLDAYDDLISLLINRPEDIYIESTMINYDQLTSVTTYKHNIKDLLEAVMVRNKFLINIKKGIFMSATLGNIDEYAILMGMKEGEYTGFRLKSTFDFEKSPIIIVKSGYLNYKNFDNVIDKLLMDTIKIAESEMHRNQKGIIHTSTFKISERLALRIAQGLVPDYNRYLFYENSEEKEYKINLMKNSLDIPYVIVGPSLYEGIDLKDDLGRFNILVKVPYSALSGYTKEKSERYPFWYKRNTIEKIIQAIGRTNRSKEDYSTVYLMDSCFGNLMFDLPDEFIERFKTGGYF